MKLSLVFLLIFPLSSAFAAEPTYNLPDNVEWTLRVTKGDDSKLVKELVLGKEGIDLPLEGTKWVCKVMMELEGKKSLMSVACGVGDHVAVLPAVCIPKLMEIFTMTLGGTGQIYGLSLRCRSLNTKAKK